MKKILFFAALLALFTACKKDKEVSKKLLVSSVAVQQNYNLAGTVSFEYDDHNRIIKQTVVSGSTTIHKYEYDNSGNLLKCIVASAKVPHEYVYRYSNGQPTRVDLVTEGKVYDYATIYTENGKVSGYFIFDNSFNYEFIYDGDNIVKELLNGEVNYEYTMRAENGPFKNSGYKLNLPMAPNYAMPNAIESSSYVSRGTPVKVKYGYTFNEQNYPTKISVNTAGFSETYTYIDSN